MNSTLIHELTRTEFIAQDKPSVQSLLRSNMLFSGLSDAEVEVIASTSRVVRAHRGEVIWGSRDQVDFFGLAGTGFVKMARGHADGTEVTLELIGPNQAFGMMGVVNSAACPLTAVAVTDLWYLRIAKRPFLQVFERSVALKDSLLRHMTSRLHGALDLLARMSGGRVEGRIAAILFLLAESYGERSGKTMTIQVPLTRQDIAEMAGTTVESCIRTMSRWQKDGLLSTDKQVITILDEPALARVMAK